MPLVGFSHLKFSFDCFEERFLKNGSFHGFQYWKAVIEGLKEEKRPGTASSYNNALKAFKKYRRNKDLLFNDISYSLLEKYRKPPKL